jgi:hypothetical protein
VNVVAAKILYGLSTLLLSWLLMQAVHEAGHVLGARLTGGDVQRVVLSPLAISRTDVSPNPWPLAEVWAGPLGGVMFPSAMWLAAKLWIKPLAAWLRFFTGFCLIANGCYLGYAVIEPVGDAEELLRHGTPLWMLSLFGLITVPLGFRLWHGLGTEFGWGPNGRRISWTQTFATCGVLIAVVAAELMTARNH